MMDFQCLCTSIVTAASTPAAQVFNRHLADFLSPFLDSLN
jgi:hypothetical protein